MLHLLLLILVELVVLNRVAERLIRSELFFNHALQHTIVRELILQLHQLLANLPLIIRLRKLCDASIVEFCFLLLCFEVFLPLALSFSLSLLFLLNLVSNHPRTIRGLVFGRRDPVNEVNLSLLWLNLHVVVLERALLLRL